MASAEEIRQWAEGIPHVPPDSNRGELLFPLPRVKSGRPGQMYTKCVGEQRVVALCEIAAQLAELNDHMRAATLAMAFIGVAGVAAFIAFAINH